jgi:hypothetical protein
MVMTTLENLLVREAELSSQVQVLDRSLADVRVHIAEMQGINRNAITYNLPVETLSAIFEIGLSESPFLPAKPKKGGYFEDKWTPLPTPFEIVVSSVSRRWRNVALQTPRLWTRVYINVAQSAHELLDLYLDRSKMCSLDITLSRRKLRWERSRDLMGSEPKAIIEFKQYLERLVPHVGRWREPNVKSGDRSMPLFGVLAALAHLYAPALETLVLDGYRGLSLRKIFSAGAPLLSSVELIGVFFLPPLEAVKHLKLHSGHRCQLSHAQFRDLIQPMRSLINLNLESRIISGSAPAYPTIDLPSVISLEIDISSCSVVEGVILFIDLPSVEILTLRDYMDRVIRTFTHRPRLYPNVRSLKIMCPFERFVIEEIPVATTLEFISFYPNVRDITFHGIDPTPIVHALYERQSTDELLWPQLSSITIVPVGRSKVSYKKQLWTDIVKLVGNRVQLGHPISSVTLSLEVIVRGTPRQQQRLKEQVTLIEC